MSEELGLKTIRQVDSNASVIFVHGVLSTSKNGWTSEAGIFWPELLRIDPTLKNISIFTFEYQTDFWSKDYSIDDAADALKESLKLQSSKHFESITFVCHSMGGIVARRAIVSARDWFAGKSIGLFLVASPSLGSSYADFFAPLATLFKHSQAEGLRTVEKNAWLKGLDKDFYDLKESRLLKIKGKELIEDKLLESRKWVNFRQVVTRFSAHRYFGEAFKVPGSDHITIAKPRSGDSIQHRLLRQFLIDMTAIAPKDPEVALSAELAEARRQLETFRDLPNRIRGILSTEGHSYRELEKQIFGSNASSEQIAALQTALGRLTDEDAVSRSNSFPDRYILGHRKGASGHPSPSVLFETMDSNEWFGRIVGRLKFCGYARIYLHSFDHPDDFRAEHREQLLNIITTLKDRIEAGSDIKIISYASSNKKSGVDWLKNELTNKSRLDASIHIRQTQKVSNSSSIYLFDEQTIIFNIKGHDQRTYHSQKYPSSILHELVKLGLEQLFEEKP
ncbi:putative alpha/beta hydrolase family esterase [Paraburkholderia sp. GAS206C]|uniref:esterase/lipase family protein n=1 Tax=unclassified Paraburkholderia TaxID=2615204 RepID=UPI003D24572F